MSKETLFAVGAGILSAAAALAFLSRSPVSLIIVYLASTPLFMAGLAMGPRAVGIAAVAGFMTAGLFGGAFIAGVYGLMQTLPAWLLVKQALLQRPTGPNNQIQWYSVGEALSWLSLLAAAMLMIVAFTVLSSERGFQEIVADNLDYLLATMTPHLGDARRAHQVGMMAPMFPGAVGGSWLVMSVVNGALAQAILVRMQRNLRPSPAYVETTLPQWMSWPLVAAATLALVGSGDLQYLGRNLAIVLAVPFFFVGLAVVHTAVRRVAYKTLFLILFYLLLVTWEWMLVAVAGIGVVEQWIGLRIRLVGPSSGGSRGGPPATTD
jgi:hypothetical protein